MVPFFIKRLTKQLQSFQDSRNPKSSHRSTPLQPLISKKEKTICRVATLYVFSGLKGMNRWFLEVSSGFGGDGV